MCIQYDFITRIFLMPVVWRDTNKALQANRMRFLQESHANLSCDLFSVSAKQVWMNHCYYQCHGRQAFFWHHNIIVYFHSEQNYLRLFILALSLMLLTIYTFSSAHSEARLVECFPPHYSSHFSKHTTGATLFYGTQPGTHYKAQWPSMLQKSISKYNTGSRVWPYRTDPSSPWLTQLSSFFKHVKEHQDAFATYNELDLPAQLNIDADQLARDFYKHSAAVFYDHINILSSCPAMLTINNFDITSQHKKQLVQAYTKPRCMASKQQR